jgi:hypothetical protein
MIEEWLHGKQAIAQAQHHNSGLLQELTHFLLVVAQERQIMTFGRNENKL